MDTTLVNEALSAATVLFGVFVTLAMTATGFFIGRSWLSKAGHDSDVAEDSNPVPIYVNSEGQAEWAIDGSTTMQHEQWTNDGLSDHDSTPY